MVPELLDGGSGPGNVAALRFVMRDMGNGVHRLEEPAVIQHGWCDTAPVSSGLTCYLTPAVLDLAQTALLVLKDRALGYVLAAPLRGIAVFLSEGVAQVTIKLACVMGALPVGDLMAMVG